MIIYQSGKEEEKQDYNLNIFSRQVLSADAIYVAQLSKQLGYNISVDESLFNIRAMRENENNEVFVAVVENEVVGWISIFYIVQLQSCPLCEIRGLVIDKKFRKQGIGKMLIENAKAWRRNKGAAILRLYNVVVNCIKLL